MSAIAYYHLPGLFEFYSFYSRFLPVYAQHRDYFYDWCEIGSIYGAPSGCLWGGGRLGLGQDIPDAVLSLMQRYGISCRLTFSNSLLREEHLNDSKCNALCSMFENSHNGIIVSSDVLVRYLQKTYPAFYLVSSTTKVLTRFSELKEELDRPEFRYVVPDFRWNTSLEKLDALSPSEKERVEFLCNECCWYGCTERKECYETVSRQNLGEDCPDHRCSAPGAGRGYAFSEAMQNPGFLSVEDIRKVYMPLGFHQFKIEGRDLGSALLLEFILYYMTKREYQLKVREELYLDAMLDLF